jgi:hypothetical protein
MGPPPGWGAGGPGWTPGQPTPPGWSPHQMMPTPIRTSGAAIAALVLSLLWICGFGSLAAIILGIVGLRATKAGAMKGRGMAIAGLVIGVLGLLMTVGSFLAIWAVADETVVTQADERDDVDIVECTRTGDGRGLAVLSITNDTSKVSDYFIIVSFRASASTVEATGDIVSEVAPDETVSTEITTVDPLIGTAPPSCSITLVQRTASR